MAGKENTSLRLTAPPPILTTIARLQRERTYRDKHGLYFVEGVRNFVTALDYKCPVESLVYSEKLLTAPFARKCVRQLKRDGVPFAGVSPEEFRTISRTERASGVGVILRQHLTTLDHVTPGDHLCWIVLDQVRAPGNFGTLIRTSAAIGAAGVILLGQTIDPYDPAVVRASMGAFFHQTFVRTTPEKLAQWITQHALQVVGASPDGTVAYNQVRYSRPTVLMLGEERKGLSTAQRTLCQTLVRIPMMSEIDSLNLGVAGSLLMYEVLRDVSGSGVPSHNPEADQSDSPQRL